ncbi:hypothetical protein MSC49_04090 [Methylosinus sp. C49]|nr:hypothetical protein MSC49_04090 [Methylosinus sp. C49]
MVKLRKDPESSRAPVGSSGLARNAPRKIPLALFPEELVAQLLKTDVHAPARGVIDELCDPIGARLGRPLHDFWGALPQLISHVGDIDDSTPATVA